MKRKYYIYLIILALLLISCNQFTYKLIEDFLNKGNKKKEIIIINE